ncbi:hypothetical protein EV421DRAFT_2038251 [Armillaria borealis]|uniref:Uncharacterized protein n=1 Tax=Armillaria borealis TaxID=47425 RepID=A0AA39MKT9_9AGAR|nr:hypothetical protein EV421DRAFT_2038251 [Armillaria borealis]
MQWHVPHLSLYSPPNALNSQVSGILRATRHFLDTDRDLILQNIEVFQQQISVYDALLDRIDEVRAEMQRRRDTVHKSMAVYSSTLAPIPTSSQRPLSRCVSRDTAFNVVEQGGIRIPEGPLAGVGFFTGDHGNLVIYFASYPWARRFHVPHHITHLAACLDNVSNLEGYQSLVECHLEAGQGPGPLHHIHLPNVRRLFVSSTRILTHLRLPSLDNLVVYGHDTPEVHTAVKMVNDFIYHSRCSLTRLATDSFVFIGQVFVKDCLSLMNTLVCLEVGLVWEVENIFNALASIGFLPNLQHLTLQLFSSIEPSFWDPFAAMISSRSRYLRSIRIFVSFPTMWKELANVLRHYGHLDSN